MPLIRGNRYRFIPALAVVFTALYALNSGLILPRQIDVELDPNPGYFRPASYLWSYVSKADASEERTAWDWVAAHRRKGYRRASWGGLRAQGPKAHMRENLKIGELYLTTFPYAGFNNEVIETMNLIAIALRSKRIPILSPFWPDFAHLQQKVAFLSVSEVFDFTELIDHYKVPVVDMLELRIGTPLSGWVHAGYADTRHKSVMYDGEHPRSDIRKGEYINAETAEPDIFRCWNAYLPVSADPGGRIGIWQPGSIEDTPMPISIFGNVSKPTFVQVSLPLIAEAISAYSRSSDTLPADSVARMVELGLPPSKMRPDDQFGCVNRLYNAHLDPKMDSHKDWRDGVGAWDEVGRYMKYQPGLEALARDLLRGLMGLKAGAEVPPYMAVHIRRTDFGGKYASANQMYFAHQAWKLLREARGQNITDVKHVVFTTDEKSEEWLKALTDIGWIHINHEKTRTIERLGGWFPTILDSVILSSAKVFLGVPGSTMSILALRRVNDWYGGLARFAPDPWLHETPKDWTWNTNW